MRTHSSSYSYSATATLLVGVSMLALLGACSKENETRLATFRTNLLAAASTLEARQYARPVPAGDQPLPGAFGDAFTAHAAEREALLAVNDESSRCLLSFTKTKDDLAKQKCKDDLGPSHAALATLLDLARTERPGAPKDALAMTPMTPSMTNKPSHRSLLAVCSRAAIEMELERDAGAASAAALTCARILEITRDYSMGTNLTGAMVVASCVEKVNDPCGRAIDALAPPDRTSVHAAIDAVATTLPAPTDYFDAELVTVPLPLCGHYLEAADRAKLGPLGQAAAVASDAQFAAIPSSEKDKHLKLCLDGFQSMQTAANAYRTPKGSPERAQLAKDHKKADNKIDVDFEKYEVKLLEMHDRVVALSKR